MTKKAPNTNDIQLSSNGESLFCLRFPKILRWKIEKGRQFLGTVEYRNLVKYMVLDLVNAKVVIISDAF